MPVGTVVKSIQNVSGTNGNVTISAVDMSKSVVMYSGVQAGANDARASNGFILLTTPTNVQLSAGVGTAFMVGQILEYW